LASMLYSLQTIKKKKKVRMLKVNNKKQKLKRKLIKRKIKKLNTYS